MSVGNSFNLIGRITHDLELRTVGESTLLNFSLARNRTYKNKDGEYETDFFNCIAWGNTAEFIGKYFEKGQRIAVSGELRMNTYEDKDGNKRSRVDLLVNSVEFADRKSDSNSNSSHASNYNNSTSTNTNNIDVEEDEDEELPF